MKVIPTSMSLVTPFLSFSCASDEGSSVAAPPERALIKRYIYCGQDPALDHDDDDYDDDDPGKKRPRVRQEGPIYAAPGPVTRDAKKERARLRRRVKINISVPRDQPSCIKTVDYHHQGATLLWHFLRAADESTWPRSRRRVAWLISSRTS